MLTIEVEGGWGADIRQVLSEMIELSKKIDVFTQQDINGVTVIANPKSTVEGLFDSYEKAQKQSIKVAS